MSINKLIPNKTTGHPFLAVGFCSLLLAGCGGEVVYDQPAGGGDPQETEYEVEGQPPPERVEEVGVAPVGFDVWIGGNWFWSGGEWRWRRGYWGHSPHPGAYWARGRWENRGGRYHYSPGRWRG